MKNFNKFKLRGGIIVLIALIEMLFILFSMGNVYGDNTVENSIVEVDKCEKTINEFLQIGNITIIEEEYKKAEQTSQKAKEDCKNDSLIFKIFGIIIGISAGLILTKTSNDRMVYERIYRIPESTWILKIGAIIILAIIILIVILAMVTGTNIAFEGVPI